MNTKALASLILSAVLAVVVLSAVALPAASGTAFSSTRDAARAESRAPGCRRDTPADLRWVSWIHRVHSGTDPSMADAARWLTALSDGQDYRSVARAVASAPTSASGDVTRLYKSLLGRSPSRTEVDGWSSTLRAHGSAHVVRSFLASGESFSRAGSTNPGWIDQVYALVLGKAPDRAGRAYWLGRLDSGTSREVVAASLWATPQSVTRRVDSSYRRVLGRAADPSGTTYWSPLVAAQGDEALDAALAASQAGWDRAQITYGAAASPMPAPCPPVARWMPAPGSIARTLPAIPGRSANLATLTFDDGPDPRWTPQVLDTLARHGVRATFFVVGNQARRHPDLVRRILAEGHRLAVHTVTHPNLLTLGAEAQRREIAGSVAIVDDIVGTGQVRCFRPPYGNRNATTDRIAADLGLATIMWSRDGRDWASPGVDHIVNANLDTRYDGGRAILLLHDGGTQRSQTVAALPRLIEELRARNYDFVQIC